MILTSDGKREEVDLSATGRRQHPEHLIASPVSEPEGHQDQASLIPAPGTSPLDDALLQLRELRYGDNGHEHAIDEDADEEQA